MFQAFFTLIASLLGFTAKAQCPNSNFHETALDCPWAEVTRSLDGVTDFARIRQTLDAKIPGFMYQLESDHQIHELFQLWGWSRNIDESNLSNGKKTAPVNLLQYFNSIWNVGYDASYTYGHAGLTHTYGYLFSVMETPYGYKRARYVRNEIEAGFGLTPGLISGLPKSGTLFSNLTTFAGKIAFRDHQRARALLDQVVGYMGNRAVPELVNYPYGSLKIKRLLEVANNDQFRLELRTDIVTFPRANPYGKNTALLIYSIDYRKDSRENSRPRLITVFPVEAGFAANLFNPSNLGDHVPLKLKYNAAITDSLPEHLMVGKRTIVE
jgi:hypothetical protein